MSATLPDLLKALAHRRVLPFPQPDDQGSFVFRVDGTFVVTLRQEGGRAVLDAGVGALSGTALTDCLERLMRILFTRLKRQPELLYLAGGETPVLRLRRDLSLNGLNAMKFEEALERYLNCLDFWHRQLGTGGPATPAPGMLFP